MIVLLLLASSPIVLYAIYRYYQWHNTYWERRGIKSPPARLFYGHWLDVDDPLNPSPLQIQRWTKKYGKVYGLYEGLRKVLVVSDPDMLQELFVKKFEYFYGKKNFPLIPDVNKNPRVHLAAAEGSRWKRLRTLAAPTFSTNSLRRIHETVEDSALNMLEFLKEHVDSGKGVDIYKFYQEYTMDVISRIAMGQEGSKQFNNPLVEFGKNFFSISRGSINYVLTGITDLPTSISDTIKKFVALRGAQTFFAIVKAVEKAVIERKDQRQMKLDRGEEFGEPNDFIDLFLESEANDIDFSSHGFEKNNVKVDKHLTTQEIVAQCFVFLVAGFDTTSNSLGYASFLLSKHPEKMKRVQEELDENIPGATINFDSLHKLNYLDCVLKETLRLYPLAAVANSRKCMKTTTLGDITIEEGVYVVGDPFSVHYNKEIWGEDADEFRPERWEEDVVRHPLSYFPFGAGPRQCIGMRLAIMEEKLALGHILKNYDILSGPESETLHLTGSFTISPSEVTVYLKSRQL